MAMRPLVRAGTQRRRPRRPAHTFQLRHRPWQIQPFLIAPVLPNETLTHALLQARAATDPVKHKLLGWWLEHHFFYVKLTDLDGRDDFEEMFLNAEKDLSAYEEAASTDWYTWATTIPWVKLCLKRVVEEWFRDEGETWDANKIGNIPVASAHGTTNNWTHSAFAGADMTAIDVTVDVDATPTPDTVSTADIIAAMRMYEFQKANAMISGEASFEDFLASYGVKTAKVEPHVPERLRTLRSWTYPSNAIDPTDGSAASALVWSVSERVSKDRYFKEPGFIFGVTVARPKVYWSNIKGAGVAMLDDAFSWLPAVLRDDPATSLKLLADNTGLGDITDATGVWIDVKDLFIYGDQFVNFALTETDAGFVALPTADLQRRYASATDADGLFAAASPLNQIRQDGIVDLDILSAQEDTSP